MMVIEKSCDDHREVSPFPFCYAASLWVESTLRVGVTLQMLQDGPWVLLRRLSKDFRKERCARSSSRDEPPSSSSVMSEKGQGCIRRWRSRCPLQTRTRANDWGNSSIANGNRWAGSVYRLVAIGLKCL